MGNFNKRAVFAILAVILAGLGIASLVVWTNGARDRAFSGTETMTVWQVTKDVESGTEADTLGGSIEQVQLPRASVPPTAVTSLGQIQGKLTTASLVPGEVLVTGRFGSNKDLDEVPVPDGLQEVTIELASSRVLGAALRKGDYVGILASYGSGNEGQTNFAVNRALVLATLSTAGAGQDGEQAAIGGAVQVRLALPFAAVEKVVHAQEFGKVYLSRQNKKAEVGRQFVTSEDVVK